MISNVAGDALLGVAGPSIPLSWYLAVALVLFTIGAVGVLWRRNALTVLMSVEIMLNAVNLTFLAFARYRGDMAGHMITFFVIAVAAAEAAVGLALVLGIFRHKKAVNLDSMSALKN
ncbi:MAG: NADH-quinone oxidoreductase subunit K [Myxococcota bacterium]|jgi:NADH-quinone oxidoreductase subunit K